MLHLLGALGRLGIRLASARAGRSADPEAARAPILGIMQEVIRAAEEREAFEFNVHVHKLHVVLAESIENHYLKRALDSIHSEYFSRELAPLLRGQHWSGIATNYRQISDLLGKGDGEAAADAFQKHMDWIIGELFGTA
jgi:DNA-binding FadR family transcriptional regulator